jgi:hypothetical protein
VKVTLRSRRRGADEHVVTVRTTIGRLVGIDGSPVQVIDSTQFDPSGLDHDGFDLATRAAHGDVRDKERAEKGRVIYVTAGGAVVGFVAFHVPPAGPFIIERLAIDSRQSEGAPDTASLLQAELLSVVAEASDEAERGSGLIAWATDVDGVATIVEEMFGFVRASKPKGSDCRLAFYLERNLDDA